MNPRPWHNTQRNYAHAQYGKVMGSMLGQYRVITKEMKFVLTAAITDA